ncbi:MAG: anti-sigma factor [Acidobacteria bacterium]|nr:anti-sigma factor [Acidobacteriota bacterium]
MSCDELKEFYELYALGVAEPEERREVEEHLERNCPNCTPGIRLARQQVAALALAAPQVELPSGLRDRVVTAVAPVLEKPTSVNWLTHAWATLAVLMLAAVLWYNYSARRLEGQLALLGRRLAAAETTNSELTVRNRLLVEALALVSLPESRQLIFGRTDREPPRGRIWVHPQRGVLLLASRLPPAPAGRIYEMWIVPKSGPPAPAGLFNSDPRGEATHVWSLPVDLSTAAAVAVTLEPEAGAPAPTSTPLIVASF